MAVVAEAASVVEAEAVEVSAVEAAEVAVVEALADEAEEVAEEVSAAVEATAAAEEDSAAADEAAAEDDGSIRNYRTHFYTKIDRLPNTENGTVDTSVRRLSTDCVRICERRALREDCWKMDTFVDTTFLAISLLRSIRYLIYNTGFS